MTTKTDLLAALPALRDIDRAALDLLARTADIVDIADGQPVTRVGQRATHCLLLVSGSLRPTRAARLFDLDELPAQCAWTQQPVSTTAAGDVVLLAIDQRLAASVASTLAPVTSERTVAEPARLRASGRPWRPTTTA
ncbi:MAG: hypothetical protein AAFP84_03290 [Actinomycetota bacterium]